MPKTHYIATAPNGQVMTRSTDRTYALCVVGKPSYVRDLALAKSPNWAPTERSNFAFYERELGPNPRFQHSERELERMRNIVATYGSAEAHVAAQMEARVDTVEARKAEGYFDRYLDLGWCGRLDLAQRLANQHCHLIDVRALPAVVAEKKPSKKKGG